MFKNHFKLAWRNMLKQKVFAVIHVAGLSLGIGACLVIYLVTSYELSFDTFHPGKDRIYRVIGDVTENTGDQLHFIRVPLAVTSQGRTALSGLDAMAGIMPYKASINVPQAQGRPLQFESLLPGTHFITTVMAEPQYFDVFQYRWLAGNAASALTAPYTVVLTESRARAYFGSVQPDQMLGRTIVYEDSLRVIVSGIVKDWHQNSDLAYTDLISFSTLQSSFLSNRLSTSWGQRSMNTQVYMKLAGGTTPAAINKQMASMVRRHAEPSVKLALRLEPLSNMHFNADVIENPIRTAHRPTLYSLMAVALFILLLAIINFVNLSTAQSIRRTKEVSVRKVLGAGRAGLMMQLITETGLLVLLALLVAVPLVQPALNWFRAFIPQDISFHVLQPSTLLFMAVVFIVTVLAAGLYPAWGLSAALPALKLKSVGVRDGRAWLLRKALIIFQFTVSLVFVIGSIVIACQLKYTREKDLGFKADAIITLDGPRGDSLSRIAVLAQKIKQLPGINQVALQWLPPMTENGRGMRLKFNGSDNKELGVAQVAGNENFIPLYGMKLLAGRNLVKTDSVNEFVINESLSRIMGDVQPEGSLGKMIYWNDKPYPVVGVVADFHTASLHNTVGPLCIINRPEREGSLAIQLAAAGKQAGDVQKVLTRIAAEWKKIYPATSFSYRFYDDTIALLYEKDRQTATLTYTAMAITIFISCMGLFGLALFTTERRAKEISIRKILGASVLQIITLLGKDTVILVVIALLVASPVAWYLMNIWLHGFAYRIDISPWMFVAGGFTILLLGLITVSFQSIRAAIMNPVKNLRQE
ncbi:MAG TPA: ABC transporter permease [Niastella sp.]